MLRPHQRPRLGNQPVRAAGVCLERGQAAAQPIGPDLEHLGERDRHRQRSRGAVDGSSQAGHPFGQPGSRQVPVAERRTVDELEQRQPQPAKPAPQRPAPGRLGPGHRQPQLGQRAAQFQSELGPGGLDGAWPAQLEEPPPALLIGHLVAPGGLPDGNKPHGAGSQPVVALQGGGQHRPVQVRLHEHASSCRRAPGHGRPTAHHRAGATDPQVSPQHRPNATPLACPSPAFPQHAGTRQRGPSTHLGTGHVRSHPGGQRSGHPRAGQAVTLLVRASPDTPW